MIEPRFGYADSDGLDIAYAVYGDGPVDVLVVTGMIGHIGMSEEVPWYREVVERVPNFARLIMMDKRGEGLSDGHRGLATYEDAIDDVRCVLDAVGSDRAVILVGTDACPLGILFAATHPDRGRGAGVPRGLGPAVRRGRRVDRVGRPADRVHATTARSVPPRVGSRWLLVDHRRRRSGREDVAVGGRALGAECGHSSTGRGALLDDRAHRRAFGVATRVVSDPHGSQSRGLRLPARAGSIRRRTRSTRDLRRAAVRQDLLVERRG